MPPHVCHAVEGKSLIIFYGIGFLESYQRAGNKITFYKRILNASVKRLIRGILPGGQFACAAYGLLSALKANFSSAKPSN
jgi:hypothetical protein